MDATVSTCPRSGHGLAVAMAVASSGGGGRRIPLDAHIRLANPRTAATADQRILRRGFNHHRGFAAGQLDQGLVFVAFNQSPARQFATIQDRLNAEPMTDYVTPVGGGYFFAPPGARHGSDWVGSGLFANA